ncbi:MAG: glycosyl transferase [Flavobacteriales bacterium]|nr:MAG: glycosyl transferase [Flavobacteriales bacterium]
MLSILIPIYNFDVVDLANELHRQAENCGIDFEILCVDDFSQIHYKEKNRLVAGLEKVEYIELKENIGRAKIRNLLADKAKFDYLLFLDCDSKTVSGNFIKNYVENHDEQCLVYGGRCYEPIQPTDKKKYLRWHYGTQREQISLQQRRSLPYKSFMTNNFLIPKIIFQQIKFNKNIKGYGHEDTLFGQELKKQQISIKHIDNCLCHIGLEDAHEFLEKTRNGVKNLALLIRQKMIDEDVRLYKSYQKIKCWKMLWTVKLLFWLFEKQIRKNLLSANPSLKKFDFYKLGILVKDMKKGVK